MKRAAGGTHSLDSERRGSRRALIELLVLLSPWRTSPTASECPAGDSGASRYRQPGSEPGGSPSRRHAGPGTTRGWDGWDGEGTSTKTQTFCNPPAAKLNGGAQEEVEEELHRHLLHPQLPPPSSPHLTCDLVPFQVDALQGRGGRQGLGEAPKLVAGEVDGPQVQQGPQLLGQPVQEVALQVELWRRKKAENLGEKSADCPLFATKLLRGTTNTGRSVLWGDVPWAVGAAPHLAAG